MLDKRTTPRGRTELTKQLNFWGDRNYCYRGREESAVGARWVVVPTFKHHGILLELELRVFREEKETEIKQNLDLVTASWCCAIRKERYRFRSFKREDG